MPVLLPHLRDHVQHGADDGGGRPGRVEVVEPGLGLAGVADLPVDEHGRLGQPGTDVDDEQRPAGPRPGACGGGPRTVEGDDGRRPQTGDQFRRLGAVPGPGEDGVADHDHGAGAVRTQRRVGDTAEQPATGLGVDDAPPPDRTAGPVLRTGVVADVGVGQDTVSGHPDAGAGAAEVEGEATGDTPVAPAGGQAESSSLVQRTHRPSPALLPQPRMPPMDPLIARHGRALTMQ